MGLRPRCGAKLESPVAAASAPGRSWSTKWSTNWCRLMPVMSASTPGMPSRDDKPAGHKHGRPLRIKRLQVRVLPSARLVETEHRGQPSRSGPCVMSGPAVRLVLTGPAGGGDWTLPLGSAEPTSTPDAIVTAGAVEFLLPARQPPRPGLAAAHCRGRPGPGSYAAARCGHPRLRLTTLPEPHLGAAQPTCLVEQHLDSPVGVGVVSGPSTPGFSPPPLGMRGRRRRRCRGGPDRAGRPSAPWWRSTAYFRGPGRTGAPLPT